MNSLKYNLRLVFKLVQWVDFNSCHLGKEWISLFSACAYLAQQFHSFSQQENEVFELAKLAIGFRLHILSLNGEVSLFLIS